jgi:D-alanyl-lipoteichoic acid acyltransferase DltB (MBOAT superfamily)
MFFNSLSYIVFLMIAVGVYWLLPLRGKNGQKWLLLSSIVFYGFWKVEFLVLIIFSAFVDYYVSLRIHDALTEHKRRVWLYVSIVIQLGLLVYFKYTYFIADNIFTIGKFLGQDWQTTLWQITLPLGISFYTFVSLSYTIDVYRRLIEPVRDFGLYLTYVMFWPHMIAGPILRGHELIAQLKQRHLFSAGNTLAGIKEIITGLFLKVVLADQLSPLVDAAFESKTAILGGLDVWTMAFGFGFQIYFDFAGYSLVAIGSARILGINFPDNFNWPYLAVSPRDFWKRWHITLSAWVRDYLYLPLSGARFEDRSSGGIDIQVEQTRASAAKLTIALFISWFIMGLWHGASWNFALWGLWHAGLIYLYRKTRDRFAGMGSRTAAVLGWSWTLPAVMLAWIPFRAANLQQTFELIAKVFIPHTYLRLSFRENFYLFVFLLLAGMLVYAFLKKLDRPWLRRPFVRWGAEVAVLSVMIFFVFVFLKPVSQFIYFQF